MRRRALLHLIAGQPQSPRSVGKVSAVPGYPSRAPEAKPAELPFERPTRYVSAVKSKTASAIGLQIPPLLLAGADEVIE